MTALACVGDNVVDIYRSFGMLFPGGNAVNVAVAARRAGVRSAYVGAVGTDDAGRILLGALADEGVETDRVRFVEGPTAYATVEVVGGERVFGPADPGVSQMTLDDADLAYLARFDLVHSGDNSMLEGQIASIARVSAVSFDFGERPHEYWSPLLSSVSIACFSHAGGDPAEAEELARRVAAGGPAIVLVTEGSRGALVLQDGTLVRVPAATAAMVDTLGAGDSLIGTFLAHVARGVSVGDALVEASRSAGRTCEDLGAFGHGVEHPAEQRLLAGEAGSNAP